MFDLIANKCSIDIDEYGIFCLKENFWEEKSEKLKF